MRTRISVIIPVYNIQEYLEECIDSVLSQSINNMDLKDGFERNLQIILIDDGSTDDSASIAKRYASQYDNIVYVYEENQGLGHARNYGCEFAEGDYIIFLDSDDKVPSKAYERMYRLAVKNNSDLTIGSVWRFNSKSTWTSTIHEIAFSGTKEITHIKESPKLFYDTTAWNKLIKRSFWEEHNFKFPEGILYEDIPVTIPLHYLANNVSMVYENCYLWRVRDGISKSITQETDDIKNMQDRLLVMGMVDKFFEDNVTEYNLNQIKYIKWIKNDLMIFINKLKSVSEDDAKEIMKVLREYIDININPDSFKYLNEIEKFKYKFLLEDDYDKLLKLLNFEFHDLSSSNIYLKDSHVMIKVDNEIFNTSSICIDEFIREGQNLKYLQSVSFKKNHIEVKGFVIIPGLKDDTFSDRSYSFYLVNSETHKKIHLKYDDVYTGDLSSFNIPYNNISYKAAGYKVYVPYSKIMGDEDFLGENRILIIFNQDGITHNVFAGAIPKSIKNNVNLHANLKKDIYFSIKFDLDMEIIIDVYKVKHPFSKVYIEDNIIFLDSPQNYGDLSLYYDNDAFNERDSVPLVYDAEKNNYSVDVGSIHNSNGHIRFDDGDIAVHRTKNIQFLFSEKGQCIVNTLEDYQYDIIKVDNLTVILDISRTEDIVKLDVELHSNEVFDRNLVTSNLYFKLNKNQKRFIFSEGEIIDDNHVHFNFDLSDKIITNNLYQGFFNVYIEYNFGDLVFSTPLYLLKFVHFTYSTNDRDCTIYRSYNRTLRLKSMRTFPYNENTPKKRKKIRERDYKYFRHLPINNKRILFESMWGSKYTCNPRFLYEYIDEYHPDYECIWVLNDENIPINGNGIRVRKGSRKYFYYLATSKYFVNNVNFNNHYIKREGQIEIQTMHGTPLKTLGLDVPGDFPTNKSKKEFIKRCKRWNYLTVQSDFVSDISKKCFLFDKEFLEFGYPRTDILFTKDNETDIKKLKEKIGIPTDKKVILYAPTWRKKNKFDLMLDIKSFKKSLSDDYVLILRLHHLAFEDWTEPEKDDFVYDLSRHDSVEELFLISNILITDYSSVMFDYSILDRPIIIFAYDIKDYGEKLRGFYVDIQKNNPGPILYTSKEVENAIINIDDVESEFKSFRSEFRKKFAQYECENSSEKIFNAVFDDNLNEMFIYKLKKIFK